MICDESEEFQRILHRRAQIRAMSARTCPHCGALLFEGMPELVPDAPPVEEQIDAAGLGLARTRAVAMSLAQVGATAKAKTRAVARKKDRDSRG